MPPIQKGQTPEEFRRDLPGGTLDNVASNVATPTATSKLGANQRIDPATGRPVDIGQRDARTGAGDPLTDLESRLSGADIPTTAELTSGRDVRRENIDTALTARLSDIEQQSAKEARRIEETEGRQLGQARGVNIRRGAEASPFGATLKEDIRGVAKTAKDELEQRTLNRKATATASAQQALFNIEDRFNQRQDQLRQERLGLAVAGFELSEKLIDDAKNDIEALIQAPSFDVDQAKLILTDPETGERVVDENGNAVSLFDTWKDQTGMSPLELELFVNSNLPEEAKSEFTFRSDKDGNTIVYEQKGSELVRRKDLDFIEEDLGAGELAHKTMDNGQTLFWNEDVVAEAIASGDPDWQKHIKIFGGAGQFTKPKAGGGGLEIDAGEFNSFVKQFQSLVIGNVNESRANIITNNLQNALSSGDNTSAYSQIFNQAKGSLTSKNKERVESSFVDYGVMGGLRDAINQYQEAGGDMGIFKGKVEDISRSIGLLADDPKFSALGVMLDREFQTYRNLMTGAAFTPAESKEYEKVNPTTGKRLDLNLAVIDGALQQMENRFVKATERILPGSEDIFNLAKGGDSEPQEVSNEEIETAKGQLQEGEILVKDKETGEIGSLPIGDFIPEFFEEIK